jgi:hypothetical protein
MHDEPTLAEQDNMIDGSILSTMIDAHEPRLWSRDELERMHGRDVTDSLNRLYGSGLIHRLKGFVWPTRAALMSNEIAL